MESLKIIMNKGIYLIIVLILLIIPFGCAEKGLYQWGNYEKFLYKRYIKPGNVTINEEINELENHISKTYYKARLIPPGLHAHLAYLYLTNGNYEKALNHLQAEKEKFPESTHFIDGLIHRIKK